LRRDSFESHPAIFTADEAWLLFRDTWRELGAFEVSFGAGLMSKEKFERVWGALPPLPEHAFARSA
jgi:hypothetical protein